MSEGNLDTTYRSTKGRLDRRDFLKAAATMGAIVALGGCSQPAAPAKSEPPKPGEPPQTGGQPAVPLAGQTTYVTIGATAMGSVQYSMGAGLAELLTKKVPGVKATVITTTGTIDRLKRFNDSRIEFGWTEPLAGYEMFTKTGQFASLTGPNIMAVAGGNWSLLQILTPEKSKIAKPSDVKGKRIGLGLPGSTGLETSRAWIEAHGVSLKDIDAKEINPDEQIAAMKDGHLDVAMIQTGAGAAAIKEITTSEKVVFLPTEEAAMRKLLEKYPPYADTQIPANSYKGQDQPVRVLGYRVSMIVRDDLSPDLVYTITKTIFENADALSNTHKMWAETTFENALEGVPFPLHPGALKYFQERKHPGLDPFLDKMRKQKLIP